ncbi:hypothetical protein DNTS_005567 [Danionella cerebrum]|uniref:Uncharacterized protein n=1 Tax=Danionella cerebrum TaxID=2873325 RepID=A0A553NJY9_9TELE|nr:hypothetical protein DNTS_005567 [Danionella translucida]TRY65725.1 hypothetical protein DNTS_005567 [Danionella translucida]
MEVINQALSFHDAPSLTPHFANAIASRSLDSQARQGLGKRRTRIIVDGEIDTNQLHDPYSKNRCRLLQMVYGSFPECGLFGQRGGGARYILPKHTALGTEEEGPLPGTDLSIAQPNKVTICFQNQRTKINQRIQTLSEGRAPQRGTEVQLY